MAGVVHHLSDLAERINAEHQQAETALREGLSHARAAGELLLQAKQQCRHGQWLPWLAANVRFSERTAQSYMRVAARWEELTSNPQRVADLPYREAVAMLAEVREVDVDGNLERAVALLGDVAEEFRRIPKDKWTVDGLSEVVAIADECVRHATAIKIDNMTRLGEVLNAKKSGRKK
jgi:hypothetical protein